MYCMISISNWDNKDTPKDDYVLENWGFLVLMMSWGYLGHVLGVNKPILTMPVLGVSASILMKFNAQY